jgi:hypothetical protein
MPPTKRRHPAAGRTRIGPAAFFESRTAASRGANATSTQSLPASWLTLLFLQLVDACVTRATPSIKRVCQVGNEHPRFCLIHGD